MNEKEYSHLRLDLHSLEILNSICKKCGKSKIQFMKELLSELEHLEVCFDNFNVYYETSILGYESTIKFRGRSHLVAGKVDVMGLNEREADFKMNNEAKASLKAVMEP